MANWTPTAEQEAIFKEIREGSGHVVITARAGCGKSTTAVAFLGMLKSLLSIVFAAFNTRIKDDMAVKVAASGDKRAEVRTLGSIGYMFCVAGWKLRSGCTDQFREHTIAARLFPTIAKPFRTLAANLAVKVKECAPFGTAAEVADLAWRFNLIPDESDKGAPSVSMLANMALQVCEASKVKDGTISFADQCYLPVVLGWAVPTWDVVIVDEAQDLNPIQVLLARMSVKRDGRIIVIGDDRQNIYQFRGASADTLADLTRELNATPLTLTVTHRCPVSVVDYVRANLVPDFTSGEGAPQGTIDTIDIRDIAEHAKAGDFILSRTNAPLMGLCLAIITANRRKPKDQRVKARIAGRDMGETIAKMVEKMRPIDVTDLTGKIEAWKARELTRAAARGNGVGEARADAVTDLADMMLALVEGAEDLQDVGERIDALFVKEGAADASSMVVLSTVHKAKGLEANHVFVLQSTLYPGGRVNVAEQNIEYVAVTRTKSHLTWVTGDTRRRNR